MIEIQNLTIRYKPISPILDNITLMLKPGHCYGLLGLNGAGKTTFLKALTGGITPKNGSVYCNYNNMACKNSDELKNIYWLPEIIALPQVSIKTFIKMNAPFYLQFDEKLFFNILKDFDVPKSSLLNKISQGQQKKFAIAFALATKTAWLLMDEPTNGLDIPSKQQFQKVLSQTINEEQGIIISTHQTADIETLVDHILILHQKNIALNESIENIENTFSSTFVNQLPKDNKYFYAEKEGLGHRILEFNKSRTPNPISLNFLFNAVISNTYSFNN